MLHPYRTQPGDTSPEPKGTRMGFFKNVSDSFATMSQNIANAPVVEAHAMAA